MRLLFVTGIALDISGAVMVLGAILRARPSEVAEEALSATGYNLARIRARDQERRYAFSGATLLSIGFFLQLVGYAWTFSRTWWLVGYAAGITFFAIVLTPLLAKAIPSKFYERAEEKVRKAVE
jgi:hypothetical protein